MYVPILNFKPHILLWGGKKKKFPPRQPNNDR